MLIGKSILSIQNGSIFVQKFGGCSFKTCSEHLDHIASLVYETISKDFFLI